MDLKGGGVINKTVYLYLCLSGMNTTCTIHNDSMDAADTSEWEIFCKYSKLETHNETSAPGHPLYANISLLFLTSIIVMSK